MVSVGRARLCAASWAVLACAMSFPALAQETAQGTAATPDGESKFEAAFFAPYNPVTAADMVARVPGFELKDGDDRRGFSGSAGNLLINGERPSSKTVPSELLKRVPASDVIRIELLSGSNAAVDVRGQSQLVNVVVKQATRQASPTTYILGARHIQYSNRVGWIAQASRTISLSPKAELALDLQIPNLLGMGDSSDVITDGSGVVTGTRRQLGRPTNVGITGSAGLRWRPTTADSVNLNVQLAPTWNGTENTQREYTTSGALRSELLGDTDYKNNYTAELGGDWEHRFSPNFSTKLVGLFSQGTVDQFDTFQQFTAPATNNLRKQDRSTENGERILRGEVKWTLSDAHTLEFGGEGAFNFRETSLTITNSLNGAPAVPVPLAVANALVEEVRGEAFITDIWTVTPQLTLETGFNFEVSTIEQTGDQQQKRDFEYPKPRFVATYVVNPKNTVRASILKDVAQLDFAEFSSSVDFVNTSSIVGNPDLVPEQAWKARLEWEARIGARGALTLAAFADEVEDVRELVEITTTDSGGNPVKVDAFGNAGDGTRRGVELRATMPLAFVGLPTAELRVSGLWQQTEVTDPITGEKRSFSVGPERQGTPSGAPVLNAGNKDWAYLINFRQNMPSIASSWGFNIVKWSDRQEYRRAETYSYNRPDPRIDLYFETTAIKPVTLRLYTNNIIPSSEERVRTFWGCPTVPAGLTNCNRANGVVNKVEYREGLGGPEGSRSFGFQVSGKF